MSYVSNFNGRTFKTKNLGWLLRHWKDVERFELAEVNRSPHGEGFMVAHLKGGGQFLSEFASYAVLADWVRRPVFRGLPAFRALVKFRAEPEDIPVRGNFASGDDEADKRLENEIISRIDAGDEWAWFYAIVEAERGDFKARDSLGACSYQNERDFRSVIPGSYYPDMVRGVLAEVRAQVIATCGEADEEIK